MSCTSTLSVRLFCLCMNPHTPLAFLFRLLRTLDSSFCSTQSTHCTILHSTILALVRIFRPRDVPEVSELLGHIENNRDELNILTASVSAKKDYTVDLSLRDVNTFDDCKTWLDSFKQTSSSDWILRSTEHKKSATYITYVCMHSSHGKKHQRISHHASRDRCCCAQINFVICPRRATRVRIYWRHTHEATFQNLSQRRISPWVSQRAWFCKPLASYCRQRPWRVLKDHIRMCSM